MKGFRNFLAIVCPPLAVIHRGPKVFLICVFLYMLYIVPGVIYAFGILGEDDELERLEKQKSDPRRKLIYGEKKTPNIKKSNNKIQYSDVNEVTIIIYPKKTNTGNVFFYDIKGNRVSKIPRGKRDLSMQYNCYLGKKRLKNSERWMPIKKDDVDKNLNDNEFVLKHSMPDN